MEFVDFIKDIKETELPSLQDFDIRSLDLQSMDRDFSDCCYICESAEMPNDGRSISLQFDVEDSNGKQVILYVWIGRIHR